MMVSIPEVYGMLVPIATGFKRVQIDKIKRRIYELISRLDDEMTRTDTEIAETLLELRSNMSSCLSRLRFTTLKIRPVKNFRNQLKSYASLP